MDDVKLKNRIEEHLNEALAANDIYDWFVIASNGSVNYNLDNENSDVDSKLLVVPSLHDLVFNKRCNYMHEMSDNGEHVEVKDIALYMNTILKQNINFVETLFAKCVIVNPKYRYYWNALRENRELIARYDTKRAVNCMLGMMKQKRGDMVKPTPGRQESIDRIGYDAKSYHHLLRLYYFLNHYLDDTGYLDCLTWRRTAEQTILMAAKEGVYNLELATSDADFRIKMAENIINNYVFDVDDNKKKYIEGLIDGVVYGVIERAVRG